MVTLRKQINRRGQSLLIVLPLILLIAFLLGIYVTQLTRHIDFVGRNVDSAAARTMAESGIQYALHQFRYGDWLSRQKPFSYQSVEIDGRGSFEVVIQEDPKDEQIIVRSVGKDGMSGREKTVTVGVYDPTSFLRHVIGVTNYDPDKSCVQHMAVSAFGSGGVASVGLLQELFTVGRDCAIQLLAHTDPLFAGVEPGSDLMADNDGNLLSRTDELPVRKGTYHINYATGCVSFAEADAGRPVRVRYDYLRRIPGRPGPFIIPLPFAPVKEGSEHVAGMRKSNGNPVAAGYYCADYANGTLAFSEGDAGAVVAARHSFLGTRITGAVRVNGDVELHNTCLLFLSRSKGENISASGRVVVSPGSKVTVWDESRHYADAHTSITQGLIKEKTAEFCAPNIDTGYFRRLTKEASTGRMVYIDNPGDIEFVDLVDKAVSNSARSPHEQPFNWNDYLERLYLDWEQAYGTNWRNGTYSPPGKLIDLASISRIAEKGQGVVVFAEGNIILRGQASDDCHVAIISGRNIYLENSVPAIANSSLLLIAEGNICINLTRVQPRLLSSRAISLYINCVAYAKRGTIGVIAGNQTKNRAAMQGVFCSNRFYPNDAWAKAFLDLEWTHDPAFCRPSRLPRELIRVLNKIE